MTLPHIATGEDGDGYRMRREELIRLTEVFRSGHTHVFSYFSGSFMPGMLILDGVLQIVYSDYRE